jgi:hypothetical protein
METFFLLNGVDVVLPGSKSTASKVQIRWSGANTSSSVAGEELLRGYSNYFRRNEPSRWLRNVPQYGLLKYENIYRGVGLVTVTMTTSQQQSAALIRKAFRGRA